ARPDRPVLADSGWHGPYVLRSVVELQTASGLVGLGETHGGQGVTEALERARPVVQGRDAFAYRAFAPELLRLGPSCYAGVELACLDACGQATRRRPSALLRGAPGGAGRVRPGPVLPPPARPSA